MFTFKTVIDNRKVPGLNPGSTEVFLCGVGVCTLLDHWHPLPSAASLFHNPRRR